ncbi:hypothetical protein QN277_025161 [Acacia crassicarpa]|uniref:Transposase MuDR plant domain-containing protein n=1 Tax=Acacia crassicarpa TaxID=499986 RepID=A0AAE1MPV4_9FABA|nr:hypothetical protein QN277_025161 [Acacia crassicarpa]
MAWKGNEEDIVRSNVEGFIELREPTYDYDEIEYLGSEYNGSDDEEQNDVNVCDKPSHTANDDDDSDGGSYSGQSSSSDSKEGSYDESEVGDDVEDETDDNEEAFGSDDERQLCVLPEAQPSGTMPYFAIGMTFQDKKEMKRAIDEYSISRGVKLTIVRSDKRSFRVIYQDGCPTVYNKKDRHKACKRWIWVRD